MKRSGGRTLTRGHEEEEDSLSNVTVSSFHQSQPKLPLSLQPTKVNDGTSKDTFLSSNKSCSFFHSFFNNKISNFVVMIKIQPPSPIFFKYYLKRSIHLIFIIYKNMSIFRILFMVELAIIIIIIISRISLQTLKRRFSQ